MSSSAGHLRVIAGALPEEVSDDALLAAFFAGSREAFGELVKRHQKAVFQVSRRFVSHSEDAADLTQGVFFRVFEAALLGDWPKGVSVRAYIIKAAINAGLNHSRQRRRWPTASTDVLEGRDEGLAPASASDPLEAKERTEALRTAALNLSERQRDVLLLRIDGELSFSEIGQAVGITEGNAKAHFHLAMKKLREAMTMNEGATT